MVATAPWSASSSDGIDEYGLSVAVGVAAAAGVAAAGVAAAAAVCVFIDSNCFDSHSCRLAVCDGLSHCAKQQGTHNPFGCASFFKKPG